MNLIKSIATCEKNGNRLLEDAECLYDYGSNATVYVLAKLSQEEFAKGFILKLVESGGLKWSPEVMRSLNHHVSKQLMTLIIDFLYPETDEFIKKVKDGTLFKRPGKVSDAINIFVYEVLKRWESKNWDWSEIPEYEQETKNILNKKEEKLKQNALYIRIDDKGNSIDYTSGFSTKMAQVEIEKAKRYRQFINSDNNNFNYEEIVKILKVMFETK